MSPKAPIYRPREGGDFEKCHYLHRDPNFFSKLFKIKAQARMLKSPSLGPQSPNNPKMNKKVR